MRWTPLPRAGGGYDSGPAANGEMSYLSRPRLIEGAPDNKDGPGLSRLLQAALIIRAKHGCRLKGRQTNLFNSCDKDFHELGLEHSLRHSRLPKLNQLGSPRDAENF
jgi:hypothetical protein